MGIVLDTFNRCDYFRHVGKNQSNYDSFMLPDPINSPDIQV